MSTFMLVASRDLRDLAGTTAFKILAAVLGLLAIAVALGAAGLVAVFRTGGPGAVDAPALVGAMLYFATLLPFPVLIWAFAGPMLVKEKASGHLETLLATPLSARTLWLAKTAAIAAPALAIAALSAALVALSVALVERSIPLAAHAAFALPAPMYIACLLGNPLLFVGLGALTVILAMRASPDAAIVPSFILGFGLMGLLPAGTALGFIDISSWAFSAAYLGAGVLEWAIVLSLARGMTKERIVLSGRED